MVTRDNGATLAGATRAALEAELLRLEEELGSEDFSEFTVDELDRRAVAGEWPWAPQEGRAG